MQEFSKNKTKRVRGMAIGAANKKKRVNHSAIQKGYEKPLQSENRHGCSNLLEL